MGEAVLDIFNSPTFFKMFQGLDVYGEPLSSFVRSYLDASGPAEAALESLSERDTEACLADAWDHLRTVLARGRRICQVTACLLCLELDPPENAAPRHVLWILNSNATELPEKTLKQCRSWCRSQQRS